MSKRIPMLRKFVLFTAVSVVLSACGGQQTQEKPQPAPAEAASQPVQETPVVANPSPYTKEVSYDNIKFVVNSPGNTSANSFTVTPSGLSASNNPITENIQGQVIDAIANDMDGDNSPEVAVIVEETPGGKRKAYVYSSFNRKSFGSVNFVDVTDASKLSGYQGGDEYEFVENTFIRRFPLYEAGQKSGKTRQFQFKMKAGEAMKQLTLDRETTF
jgi:hypothetical protein